MEYGETQSDSVRQGTKNVHYERLYLYDQLHPLFLSDNRRALSCYAIRALHGCRPALALDSRHGHPPLSHLAMATSDQKRP